MNDHNLNTYELQNHFQYNLEIEFLLNNYVHQQLHMYLCQCIYNDSEHTHINHMNPQYNYLLHVDKHMNVHKLHTFQLELILLLYNKKSDQS